MSLPVMALWLTEGLSVRFLIYYIENRLSYPLRHFVTPPLSKKGGMGVASCYLFTIRGVFFIMAPLCKEPAHPPFMAPLCKGRKPTGQPSLCKEGRPTRQPPLCKGGKWKGGLSRLIFDLHYRKRTFLSPPSLCDTSPFQKGRHNEWA